jgi:hypothetical protein
VASWESFWDFDGFVVSETLGKTMIPYFLCSQSMNLIFLSLQQ